MFGRRPKFPVSPEQQEWIEKSFLQFFPRKWEETEDWARDAFDRVCALMQVPKERVKLEFGEDSWAELRKTGVPLGPTRGVTGTYRERKAEYGPALALISVKDALIREPEVMVGVMAHELAHVLLLGDNKISHEIARMEPLTDLMTVFCGFGVFTANAAHVHKSSLQGWSQSSHGYLSQREYGYSLALFAWGRGEPDPAWASELTTNVRIFMRATLSNFKASKRPV